MTENETSSPNIEAKGDVKKLIRFRGGNKAAFTNSDSKIDLKLSQSIANEEQLCEAEALLANLKSMELSTSLWCRNWTFDRWWGRFEFWNYIQVLFLTKN